MQIHPHSKHPWGEATDVGSPGDNQEARRECPSASRLRMETMNVGSSFETTEVIGIYSRNNWKVLSILLGNIRTKTVRSKLQRRDLTGTCTLPGIL